MTHDGSPPLTPLGIFAKTFAGSDPRAVLAQARHAGFDAVQYNMACSGLEPLPTVVPRDVALALRDASAEFGVAPVALSATYNMIHPDLPARIVGQQALAALAEVAHTAGIPILTLCTGSRNRADQWAFHPDNGSEAAWRDLLVSMSAAIDVADRYDLRLGVEPEPGNIVDSAGTARRLIDEFGSDRIGIVMDAANLLSLSALRTPALQYDEIAAVLDLVADRVILVHAKDRTSDGRVVAPGQGAIDFPQYFEATVAAGVQAPVVTHGLDVTDAHRTAVFLRACLQMN